VIRLKTENSIKARILLLPVIFIVFLALDILTKRLVQNNLEMYEVITVIPGFFNITYLLNPGAAFGMLQDKPEIFRKIFFSGVTLIACAMLITLLIKEARCFVRSVSYVLILAGAAGNLYDRVCLDKVVDFLDFYIGESHWYTFNLADSCITVGVAVLVIELIVSEIKKRKNINAGQES
jgi:signal peptidase II